MSFGISLPGIVTGCAAALRRTADLPLCAVIVGQAAVRAVVGVRGDGGVVLGGRPRLWLRLVQCRANLKREQMSEGASSASHAQIKLALSWRLFFSLQPSASWMSESERFMSPRSIRDSRKRSRSGTLVPEEGVEGSLARAPIEER